MADQEMFRCKGLLSLNRLHGYLRFMIRHFTSGFSKAVTIIALCSHSPARGDFQFVSDGAFITINGYTGTAVHLIIPDTLSGLPVTSIQLPAFLSSPGLKSVVVGNHVTNIGSLVFSGQASLTNILLPNGLRSVGDSAFSGCASLSSIQLPATLKTLGIEPFLGCTSLKSIQVAPGNPFFASIDGILYDASTNTIYRYPPARTNQAFSVPPSVTRLAGNAFNGAARLQTISLPPSVGDIDENVFANLPGLAALYVDPASTNYLGKDGVLYDTEETRLLRYPPAKTNTSYASPLTTREISRGAFAGATNLIELTLNPGLESIASEAFLNCLSLSSVSLPDSVTSMGSRAFENCAALEQITLPSQLGFLEASSFAGCTSLRRVELPESLQVIGSQTFQRCVNLTQLFIPDGFLTLGDFAFAESGIRHLFFRGNPPENVSANAFSGTSPDLYYDHRIATWTNSIAGITPRIWPAAVDSGPRPLGVAGGNFGFSVIGSTGETFVVEAATSMSPPVWTPVFTGIWTQTTVPFTYPAASAYRFFRLSIPE
jgi:hypothetical protein